MDLFVGSFNYPRKKQYIRNLNTLLSELERQKYTQNMRNSKFPSFLLAEKKFKQDLRSGAQQIESESLLDQLNKKNQLKESIHSKNLHPNLTMNEKRMPLSERMRSKSTACIYNQSNQPRNGLTKHQQRKQKFTAILSTQNIRKQLQQINQKKKHFQRFQSNKDRSDRKSQKSFNSKQNTNQAHQKINILSRSCSRGSKKKQTKQENSQIYDFILHYQSEQLKRSEENKQYPVQNSETEGRLNSLNSQYNESNAEKKFLRKGSSLNKNILNTIIKLKLSKDLKNEEGNKNFFKNEEIVNLIKVYKGIEPSSPRKESNSFINQTKPKGRQLAFIEGWNNERDQSQINFSQSQSQALALASTISRL